MRTDEIHETNLSYRRIIGTRAYATQKGTNATGDSAGLNRTSSHVTQAKSQGASQAMLYATGLKPEDMEKAQVGISSVWYAGNPCNMHLMDLSNIIKEGVQRAGTRDPSDWVMRRDRLKCFDRSC